MDGNNFYSTKEVAEILRVDTSTVRRWIAEGALEAEPQIENGRPIYKVPKKALDRIINSGGIN